jgi:sugar lactone lactonase YvrE
MYRARLSGIPPICAVVLILAAAPSFAQTSSFYPTRLEDAQAVYLTSDRFAVRGDGVADDSAAIQAAIDKVQETTGEGIVFIPSGRYRVTTTIYVWGGIRLIGNGATRPVLLLGPNTPGYGNPSQEKYMVFFSGGRPGAGGGGRGGAPAGGGGRGATGGAPRDAGAGTFYSALSNVDIEIGEGNPGAVGVRGRYAQHSFIAHSDFHIGSGLAGVHDTGNVMEDVHFHGGDYGIWTQRPSPGWQFTAVDATFDGQRVAAIRERAAGLTLIRPRFSNVPTAIAVEPTFHDEMWIKNGRFENISGPAVIISNEKNPQTEINMEDSVCDGVPVFAQYQESNRSVPGPGARYKVRSFSYGLTYADVGATPATRQVFDTTPLTRVPAPVASDLAALPSPETWVNIRTLGAKGDGTTDDTDVFRKAIAEHRAIYVPSGFYVVTDTLTLRPDTVLIGLHPDRTQIIVPDRTPAFAGIGGPKPLIEAPQGGTNILVGIGLYTNGINPRAVAVKWMAGASSMLNDVRFLGGHGTSHTDGSRENPYNNTHTADPDLNRRWDGQYPSLWVTDGGGGTFFDIWTPSTFAQAGMLVSNTSTEGRIYEMSSEHHVRHEVQLHSVSNWQIYALQTEEERGEGGFALPLEIVNSSNITVANMFIYRVISMFQPLRNAIETAGSKDIRFRNVHSYSNSKVSFDTTIYDRTHRVEIRRREFASLTVSGSAPAAKPSVAPVVRDVGARVQRLTGGFYNISGGAVDPSGDYYFVDSHWQRIYRWHATTGQLSTVRDNALDPGNLAIDKAGNLLVTSFAGNGTVYTFKPDAVDDEVTLLKPAPVGARAGDVAWLPVSDWHVNKLPLTKPAAHFVSPDGTTFLATGQDFLDGAVSFGIKSSGQLRSFGLAPVRPGQLAYVTDESDQTTWSGLVGPDGALSDMKIFAYQGGESVAVDVKGNVYIAAGQIYVYDPAGTLVETIDVPERPTHLAFGGKDHRTLFIAARTSLYSVRTTVAGR